VGSQGSGGGTQGQHQQIKSTAHQFSGDQAARDQPPNACVAHAFSLLLDLSMSHATFLLRE
jgi:hypothetical protein